MTRQRAIPSIQYRSANLVDMTMANIPGVPKIRISGAARLNDAYGDVAGVGGGGVLPMFEVMTGGTYLSPSVKSRKWSRDESGRDLTRMVFDPDDFATPAQAPGTSYLSTDDQALFLRVETWNPATGGWNPPGPIMIVCPYDFFTTKEPVFTVTGKAPNLDISDFPDVIPDFLPPTVLNFLVPAYSTTASVGNLDSSKVLYVSFHPGMPPTVVLPQTDVTLTGSGVPEFFIGAASSNPWFTIRIAVVNSA